MKKLAFLIILTLSLHATDYYSIVESIAQNEVNKFRTDFDNYNAFVLDASAGMVAISNIDFNPDHQGFSAGVGLATIHTGYGNGNAYALGMQYVHEDTAINIKGSYGEQGQYILGTGLVVGF